PRSDVCNSLRSPAQPALPRFHVTRVHPRFGLVLAVLRLGSGLGADQPARLALRADRRATLTTEKSPRLLMLGTRPQILGGSSVTVIDLHGLGQDPGVHPELPCGPLDLRIICTVLATGLRCAMSAILRCAPGWPAGAPAKHSKKKTRPALPHLSSAGSVMVIRCHGLRQTPWVHPELLCGPLDLRIICAVLAPGLWPGREAVPFRAFRETLEALEHRRDLVAVAGGPGRGLRPRKRRHGKQHRHHGEKGCAFHGRVNQQ